MLLGENEIDPVTGDSGAGDPDGFGAASGVVDGTRLCYTLNVKNLDLVIAAHIHAEKAGANGPVVVPLVVQPAPGDPGLFVGCIGLPATLLEELLDHPNEFYWNVHTAVFPAGAIRGQVFLEKN